ncbi:hypothetical protein F3Y22_tig00111842pilonHSYRG00101 [Hibiscus syriacus]|uniref:Isopenicillin N synthase-like Fe(2+) 2OG dioxygenase domain-containing protein n=1 Tax=Hibiscus syriacus TaxID=106335 RepID=A0A6A2XRC1_HIBSY|nr:hypothetical protein F3Y22_tig00111842pilonHSYRG00101 [Hibiscus syriacus]
MPAITPVMAAIAPVIAAIAPAMAAIAPAMAAIASAMAAIASAMAAIVITRADIRELRPAKRLHKQRSREARAAYGNLQVGGLQVLKDGKWLAVNPHPDAFVINMGDQLQALSNGRYKSVWHRAIVNSDKARMGLTMNFSVMPG